MEVAALHSDHYTHVQVRDFIEPCPQAFNQEKVGMGLRPWKRLHVDITIRDIKNILLEIFISNNTRGIKSSHTLVLKDLKCLCLNKTLTGIRKVFMMKSMNLLASSIVDMYPNDILTDPVGWPSTMSIASPHT